MRSLTVIGGIEVAIVEETLRLAMVNEYRNIITDEHTGRQVNMSKIVMTYESERSHINGQAEIAVRIVYQKDDKTLYDAAKYAVHGVKFGTLPGDNEDPMLNAKYRTDANLALIDSLQCVVVPRIQYRLASHKFCPKDFKGRHMFSKSTVLGNYGVCDAKVEYSPVLNDTAVVYSFDNTVDGLEVRKIENMLFDRFTPINDEYLPKFIKKYAPKNDE